MIHDWDYYSIVDKDKILLLLDEIEQKIILFATKTSYDTILCSQDIWARILILQRKWRALSGIEDCPCEAFRKAKETFYSGSWIVLHKSGILIMLQIEPGTNGKYAPIGQAQKYGSSANRQEIPVSMENVCPEGNKYQYVTSPSGEDLMRNFHVRHSKRIRKSPQRYNP